MNLPLSLSPNTPPPPSEARGKREVNELTPTHLRREGTGGATCDGAGRAGPELSTQGVWGKRSWRRKGGGAGAVGATQKGAKRQLGKDGRSGSKWAYRGDAGGTAEKGSMNEQA